MRALPVVGSLGVGLLVALSVLQFGLCWWRTPADSLGVWGTAVVFGVASTAVSNHWVHATTSRASALYALLLSCLAYPVVGLAGGGWARAMQGSAPGYAAMFDDLSRVLLLGLVGFLSLLFGLCLLGTHALNALLSRAALVKHRQDGFELWLIALGVAFAGNAWVELGGSAAVGACESGAGTWLTASWWGISFLGALLFGIGVASRQRRFSWLRRVAAGLEPGLSLTPNPPPASGEATPYVSVWSNDYPFQVVRYDADGREVAIAVAPGHQLSFVRTTLAMAALHGLIAGASAAFVFTLRVAFATLLLWVTVASVVYVGTAVTVYLLAKRARRRLLMSQLMASACTLLWALVAPDVTLLMR